MVLCFSYIVYILLWMKGPCWNMLEHSKTQFSFSKTLYIIKINARSWLTAEDDRVGVGECGLEAWNHINRFQALSQLLSQYLHLIIKVYWKIWLSIMHLYNFVNVIKRTCRRKHERRPAYLRNYLESIVSDIPQIHAQQNETLPPCLCGWIFYLEGYNYLHFF